MSSAAWDIQELTVLKTKQQNIQPMASPRFEEALKENL